MHVTNARFLTGASEPKHFPRHAWPEVAFAGRSNVGKSSLLNALVGRRGLARVSKTPGRTQQINFFVLNERLVFVDLPGYGFARVPLPLKQRWKRLVEGYLSARRQLRGVVVIVDCRRGVQSEDEMLLEFLQAESIPVVLVATKTDKLNRAEERECLRELALRPLPGVRALVGTAAPTGEGVRRLWSEIEALAAS